VSKTGRLRLAPEGYQALTGFYLLVLVIAVGMGVLHRSPDLVTEARVFLIPGSLLFIFLNLPVTARLEAWVLRWFYKVGVVAFGFGLLMQVSPTLRSLITFPTAYWLALYAGVFTWSIVVARLLWNGFSWSSLGLLLMGIAVLFVFLSNKPIVFTMLVVLAVLTGIALRSDESRVRTRAWGVTLAIPSVIVATLLVLPQSIINQLVGIFARRYLKIWAVSSVQDLQSSLSEVGQAQDLSAGRFEIWQSYFSEASAGFGLAPEGFGGIPTVTTSLHGVTQGFPAHSTIAYLAYHAGIIAAILYGIIILRFLIEGFQRIHRLDIENDYLSRPEIVGVFAFVVGLIAVGLVGGPLMDYRLAWFFWFLTAALVKRWNQDTVKSTRVEGETKASGIAT
jgi:hypothetical protein